jgi:hypothetical protein
MSQPPNEESRLRAAEAQMRRALGLDGRLTSEHDTRSPSPAPTGTHHTPRRFVRDGDIQVAVVQRSQENGTATNRLAAVQQALAEQTEARDQVERFLQEAQATIKELQTKLAHERMANDESVRRAEDGRQAILDALQTAQKELEFQRQARWQAEQERDEAIAARQEVEERLLAATPAVEAPKLSRRAVRGKSDETGKADTLAPMAPPVAAQQRGRRGRSPKVKESGDEVVEWWKPGWQEKYR